jgi:hypothetical protein
VGDHNNNTYLDGSQHSSAQTAVRHQQLVQLCLLQLRSAQPLTVRPLQVHIWKDVLNSQWCSENDCYTREGCLQCMHTACSSCNVQQLYLRAEGLDQTILRVLACWLSSRNLVLQANSSARPAARGWSSWSAHTHTPIGDANGFCNANLTCVHVAVRWLEAS